jgi:dihydroorotate dehydrogenase electron transfer subunit
VVDVLECRKNIRQLRTRVLQNECIAKSTMRIRVVAPHVAQAMLPGQFVMIRVSDCQDPLIGRALAIYDRVLDENGNLTAIDLVYLVKGKMTTRLAQLLPGQAVELVGPLGNAFSDQPVDHLVLVAGGIGQTPMLVLGKEALGKSNFGTGTRRSGYAKRVTLCYGVRSKDYVAGLEQFQQAGLDVRLIADDGSIGPAGRVTDLLKQVLDEANPSESTRIACCGPEVMMEAVSQIAAERQIEAEVSLETPMACGIGICFTCVAKVGQQDDWDYKRTCVEGPIFQAASIVW